MFGSIMNKVQFRLIMTLIILWLGGGIVLTAMNAGVFFSVASGQVQNYNSIKTEQLKNKLPVEGNLYMVYGLVADGYTENVDDYGNTTVSNKEYYYAVPFEDDSVLIVLVKQESKLDRQIDALYEASYGDGSDPLLMTGVPISGVLRPTESEVEQYTIEAFAEVGITDVKVESYTLDCKKSVREFVTLFWIGVALILSFVAVAVFMFIKTRSSNRTNSFAPASSAVPSGSFGSYNPNTTYPTLGSSNKYNPDMMFSSADRVIFRVAAEQWLPVVFADLSAELSTGDSVGQRLRIIFRVAAEQRLPIVFADLSAELSTGYSIGQQLRIIFRIAAEQRLPVVFTDLSA